MAPSLTPLDVPQNNMFATMQIKQHTDGVGQKSDTLLVLEVPVLFDVLYLQFLFTSVSFSSNDVFLRLST